jgi:hypothetical protein
VLRLQLICWIRVALNKEIFYEDVLIIVLVNVKQSVCPVQVRNDWAFLDVISEECCLNRPAIRINERVKGNIVHSIFCCLLSVVNTCTWYCDSGGKVCLYKRSWWKIDLYCVGEAVFILEHSNTHWRNVVHGVSHKVQS